MFNSFVPSATKSRQSQGAGKISLEVVYRPGKWMRPEELRELQRQLCEVAYPCLNEIPNYQCLRSDLRDMDRLIIALAYNQANQLVGFCSSYLLDYHGESILHLGLTCVGPEARGKKLTHRLTSKVIFEYLTHRSPFRASWVSNVACVLSSLGNVANYFDAVYPSPFNAQSSAAHLGVARYINKHYRDELYVREEARFNEKTFVFEESVLDNMFQKDANDKRYFHRKKFLNLYYQSLLNFDRGDEVLQIAKVSWMTFPRYFFKQLTRKFKYSKFWKGQDQLREVANHR